MPGALGTNLAFGNRLNQSVWPMAFSRNCVLYPRSATNFRRLSGNVLISTVLSEAASQNLRRICRPFVWIFALCSAPKAF